MLRMGIKNPSSTIWEGSIGQPGLLLLLDFPSAQIHNSNTSTDRCKLVWLVFVYAQAKMDEIDGKDYPKSQTHPTNPKHSIM